MNIGTFDVAVREADPDREPDTFVLCGQTFTLEDDVSALPFMKFAAAGARGEDSAEMIGLDALLSFFQGVIVSKEWFRFETVVQENKVKDGLLMEIAGAIIEAKSGNPSEPSSDSSGGRRSTSQRSRSGRGKSAKRSTSGRDTIRTSGEEPVPVPMAGQPGYEPTTAERMQGEGMLPAAELVG